MQDAEGVILATHALAKNFNGFRAVDGVDLTVRGGTVHALVGPNGAGKTTLFNLLTGFIKPSAGRIEFAGRDITTLAPQKIAQLGLTRSFQVSSLFPQLSLLEHVELALQSRTNLGHRFWLSDRRLARFRDHAMQLLTEVGLQRLPAVAAGALPYGQKRALELALGLALSPRLLLLDEPTAGMGVEDVERTVELISRIRRERTIVMVEHNMSVVASLADRVTVLQRGAVLVEGPYSQVRADPRVISAYLGEPVA